MSRIVLKNGEIAFAERLMRADVVIEEGKIIEVVEGGDDLLEGEVVDCEGKIILPGLIDVHVHFREPGASYKEDWETGSRAACKGGVTTVFDMPNNQPSIIDLNNLEAKKQLISGRSYVNYGLYMGFDGSNFDEINKTKNIPGVKIYCAHSTGKMGVVDDHIELAFEKIDERVRLLFHAEDEECIGRKREIVLGKYNGENIPPFVHSEIRAPECAVTMVRRLCELAKKYRRAIHICHVSTEEELDIISKYREYGVTCEVAPHHLVLSDEDYDELGNLVKINPPLRRKAEVFAMWKGLKNGFVDIVATDHAPHTLEEKKMGYIEAPSGVPGVEMMLPILLNTVNNGGMTIMDVVKLCCEKPAEIFGLEDKGRIEVGYDADLVVVDMEMEKKFSNEDVESKCGWSPYAGGVFKGWPLKTFVAGVLVCDDGKFSGNTSGNIVKFRR